MDPELQQRQVQVSWVGSNAVILPPFSVNVDNAAKTAKAIVVRVAKETKLEPFEVKLTVAGTLQDLNLPLPDEDYVVWNNTWTALMNATTCDKCIQFVVTSRSQAARTIIKLDRTPHMRVESVFKAMPKRDRFNRRVAAFAVCKDVKCMKYVSPFLQLDKQFLLTTNLWALAYVAKSLRADKEVIERAIMLDAVLLVYAAPSLHRDEAFIDKLSQQNPYVRQHVRCGLD